MKTEVGGDKLKEATIPRRGKKRPPSPASSPSDDGEDYRDTATSRAKKSKSPMVKSSKKSSKTHSIDETLDDLSNVIRTARKRQSREDSYDEEIAQVKQILEEDGYSENDVVFMQALNLCLNKRRRLAFLDLKSKEGRLKWVKVSWDFAALISK